MAIKNENFHSAFLLPPKVVENSTVKDLYEKLRSGISIVYLRFDGTNHIDNNPPPSYFESSLLAIKGLSRILVESLLFDTCKQGGLEQNFITSPVST